MEIYWKEKNIAPVILKLFACILLFAFILPGIRQYGILKCATRYLALGIIEVICNNCNILPYTKSVLCIAYTFYCRRSYLMFNNQMSSLKINFIPLFSAIVNPLTFLFILCFYFIPTHFYKVYDQCNLSWFWVFNIQRNSVSWIIFIHDFILLICLTIVDCKIFI